MQASNHTLDAMLAKPATGSNQGDIGSGAVSDYNKRDNSFDNVLQEQRQRHSRSQGQDGAAEPRKQPESPVARQDERQPADSEVSSGGADAAASGNGLPAAEEDSPTLEVAAELSGLVPEDLEATESAPADDAESAEVVVADAAPGAAVVEQDEARAGGEMIAAHKPGAQAMVNDEAGKAQRVAPAPVAVTSSQREAGQAAATLPGAVAEQANSVRTDNSPLQETQAFKDALQQLSKGDVAPASTAALARTEAAGNVEQAAQNLLRVDSLLSPGQAAAAAKPEVAVSTIQVPVSSPNWGQAVAQRVLWMANNGVQAAELQLHPRELGPVEIRISVSNDQTQVQFSSQYGVVRESLESSMQRLRELFDASGMQLVDVNVSDQSLAEQQQSAEEESAATAGKPGSAEEAAPLVNEVAEKITGAGLVDYYA